MRGRNDDDDSGPNRVGFRRHTSPHQTLEKLDRREHEEDLTPRQIAGIHGMRARVKHQLEEEMGDHNNDYSDEENDFPKKRRVARRSDNVSDELQKLQQKIIELEKFIRGYPSKRVQEQEDDYEEENYNRRGRRTTNQHVDPRETLRKLDRKEHEEDLSVPQIMGIHGKRAQVMNQIRGGGGRGAGREGDFDDYGDEDNRRGRGTAISRRRKQNYGDQEVDYEEDEQDHVGRGHSSHPRQTLDKLNRREQEGHLTSHQIAGIHGMRARVKHQLGVDDADDY